MKIQIRAIEHRGEKRIRLDFKKDNSIISEIKQIKGRKWSQTKRCWHLPYTKAAFEALKAMFGDDLVLPEKVKEEKGKIENLSLASPEAAQKIKVEVEHDSRVKVFMPWQRKDWIEKIKSLPDRAWNKEKRYWSVPKKEATLAQLKQYFGDHLDIDKSIQWQSAAKKTASKPSDIFTVHQDLLLPKFIEREHDGQKMKAVIGNQIIVNQYTDDWLAAFVPYDKKIWIEIVKSIDGRRWNSDESCWLIPHVKNSLDCLKQIRELYFNFELRTDLPEDFSKPKKHEKHGKYLLNEMQQKAVTALEEKLLLERKSWRTIKTYKNLLIGLLLYYPNSKPSQISSKAINNYFLHCIKNKKIAISTQNQMINAFKAFYEKVLEQSGKVV
ncbi:MAG: site-specific integrase [Bacteroidota bacterium]